MFEEITNNVINLLEYYNNSNLIHFEYEKRLILKAVGGGNVELSMFLFDNKTDYFELTEAKNSGEWSILLYHYKIKRVYDKISWKLDEYSIDKFREVISKKLDLKYIEKFIQLENRICNLEKENEKNKKYIVILEEQIQLYPESEYILENVKKHFDSLK